MAACGRWSAGAGLPGQPPAALRKVVLTLPGSVTGEDLTALRERVLTLLERTKADVLICDAGALTDPDAETVDVLAQVGLTVRRLGRSVRFHHAGPRLRELLALTGLHDVGPWRRGFLFEPLGEPEQGKQVRRVEERIHRDDASP